MRLLIDSGVSAPSNGNGYVDYTKYVVDGSIVVEDSINVPTLLTFQLSNVDNAFVTPARSCYVKLVSEIYAEPTIQPAAPRNPYLQEADDVNSAGKVLATGVITNSPDIEYVGLDQNIPSANFQRLNYNVHVSSEEWLLNSQVIPFIPAFVNKTDSQILAAIANTLMPGFFDTTSMMASGNLIPYYQYDPTQTWSDIAKTFADSNRYYYKVKNKKIIYQPFGQVPPALNAPNALGISYDETTQTEPELYPAQFKTNVVTIPPINDCLVLGDYEPQDNWDTYFVGDGFTSNFQLRYQAFQGTTSNLLQDDWTDSSFSSSWVVNDPQGAISLADSNGNALGALNIVQKGVFSTYTPIQDATYVKAQNGLELGGGLNLQHGQFTFNDTAASGGGIVGGLFEEAISFDPGNCLCAFAISGQPSLGNFSVVSVTVSGAINEVLLTINGVNGNLAPGNVFTGTSFVGASFLNGQLLWITAIQQNNGNYVLTCSAQNQGVLPLSYGPAADSGTITFANNGIINTASGSAGIYIYPLYNGSITGSPVITQPNHQYVLQTWIGAEAPNRFVRPYTNLTRTATFGAQNLTASGTITWVITDVDIGNYVIEQQFPLFGLFPASPPPIVTKFFIPHVSLPPFALYVLLSGLDLNLSVNYTELSLPPQGYLTVQSLTGTSGGNLPVLPQNLGPAIPYQLGFGMINQTAQIGQQGEAYALEFYTDDIPSVGARIRFQSWASGQAIARVQDKTAIANEAKVSGDSGIRSAVMANLSPLPRTSAECEAAAAATILDREYPQFQGSYTLDTLPYRFTSLFSPSMYDYPHTGLFFNIFAPSRGVYTETLLGPTTITPPVAPSPGQAAIVIPPTVGSVLNDPTCPNGFSAAAATGPTSGVVERLQSDTLQCYTGDQLLNGSFTDPELLGIPHSAITAIYIVARAHRSLIASGFAGLDVELEKYDSTNLGNTVVLPFPAFAGFGSTTEYNVVSITPTNFDWSLATLSTSLRVSLFGTFNPPDVITLEDVAIVVYYNTAGVNTALLGQSPSNYFVNTVRTQVVEMRDEHLLISLDYGPDLYLEKLLPSFLEREQNLLTPNQTAPTPNPITVDEVLNASLPTLDGAQVLSINNSLTGNYIVVDLAAGKEPNSININATITALGATGVEVRYVDDGWGIANKGRVGIFTTDQFTLPRTVRDQTFYLRGVNGSIFSRFSKALRVVYPLIPSAPTLKSSDPTTVVFDLAGDVRDIYGLEVRVPSVSGATFVQFAPGIPVDTIAQFNRNLVTGTPSDKGNVVAQYGGVGTNGAPWKAHTVYPPGSVVSANAGGSPYLFQSFDIQPWIAAQNGSPIPNTQTGDYVNVYYWELPNATQFGPYGASASSAAYHAKVNSVVFNAGNPGSALHATMTNFSLNQAGEVVGVSIPWGGATTQYSAVLLYTLDVPAPGTYEMIMYNDDGFFYGIDGGASQVSGPNTTHHATTSMNGYPVLGGVDAPDVVFGQVYQVNFPTAGRYNIEIDFFKTTNPGQILCQVWAISPYIANGGPAAPVTDGSYPMSCAAAPTFPSILGNVVVENGAQYYGPFGIVPFSLGGNIGWKNIGPPSAPTPPPYQFQPGDIVYLTCQTSSDFTELALVTDAGLNPDYYFSYFDYDSSIHSVGSLSSTSNIGTAQLVQRTTANWNVVSGSINSAGIATIQTSVTHSLSVGQFVIISCGYTSWPGGSYGTQPLNTGAVFCGVYEVIGTPSSNQFQIQLTSNPYPGGLPNVALTGLAALFPENQAASGGVILQRVVTAPSDLVVDLTQPDIAEVIDLLAALVPNGRISGIEGLFFNLTWDYSAPTPVPAFNAPAITGLIIDPTTQQILWNLHSQSGTPDGYRVEVTDQTSGQIRNKYTIDHISNKQLLTQLQMTAQDYSSAVTIKVTPFDSLGDGLPAVINWPGASNSGVSTGGSIQIGATLPITINQPVPNYLIVGIDDFIGDTGLGGFDGAVPAPPSGSAAAGMFLSASGIWAVPFSSSGTLIGTVGITTSDLAASGSKGYIQCPYAGTIIGWTLIGDVIGSAQFTVKKGTVPAFPTNSSVVGSAPPNLSTQQLNTSTTLTGWTTNVAQNDVFEFVLNSASTVSRLTLQIFIKKS